MLNIVAIETKEGYYITKKSVSYNKGINYNYNYIGDDIIIDNEKSEPTFHEDWVFIKNKPTIIKENVKVKSLVKYELKEKTDKQDLPNIIYASEFEKIRKVHIVEPYMQQLLRPVYMN